MEKSYICSEKNISIMILFPNAKINLGLQVTSRRPDGYHNLDTVFLPIPLRDSLEVVARPDSDSATDCVLHLLGNTLEGNPDDNLVTKAYRLLKQEHDLPPVEVWLYKHIPSGAGLGGGSADAAFMLTMLNGMFALGIDDDRLEAYATTLGADCPIFIRNKPVYATGIGNIFSPIDLSLSGYHIVVVKPSVFVSTREAFRYVKPAEPAITLDKKILRPVEEWRHIITNDFEFSVFPQYPQLGFIKDALYEQGAVYASMSGSGSALYGLFRPDALPHDLHALFPDCFCWTAPL